MGKVLISNCSSHDNNWERGRKGSAELFTGFWGARLIPHDNACNNDFMSIQICLTSRVRDKYFNLFTSVKDSSNRVIKIQKEFYVIYYDLNKCGLISFLCNTM